MNKIKILESAIIGFLVGATASTYILFILNTGKSLGKILSTLSLNPLLKTLPSQYSESLTMNFIFYVFVFIIYGIVIGIFFGKSVKRNIVILLLIILLFTGVFFEQKSILHSPTNPIVDDYIDQTLPNTQTRTTTQYFGDEARGDLNNDNLEDIAFILKSIDDENNTELYLAASINSTNGYTGTNFIFIGQEISITSIKIENAKIHVTYSKQDDTSESEELVSKDFYAQIKDGQIVEIDSLVDQETTSTSTQEIIN